MKLLKKVGGILYMTTVLLNINIDKDLRDELKIIAIRKNTTITEILTTYIEEYVNENK